ncbi:MAG TPA: permease [Chthoniobacterales bacterium]
MTASSWFSFNLNDFSFSFLSILFEGVPFLLAGTLISGFIDAFLPSQRLDKLLPKRAGLAILLGGLLGLIFPMCECGVIPVIRRMIRKGLPVAPAMTYLLAAPIVNPVVALSTYAAFRGQDPATVLAFRLALGFGIACVAGAIVLGLPKEKILTAELVATARPVRKPLMQLAVSGSGLASNETPDDNFPDPSALEKAISAEKPSVGQKLLAALRTACGDFLDVAFYLVLGAAITAVFNTAVSREQVILPLASNVWFATYALTALAGLLSLCSTSDAFVAANFVAFPLAAKLAFMVFGPMMDLKLLFLYSLVFRKRFTVALAVALFVGIGLLCVHLASFIQ